MREILFRAWIKSKNKMVDVSSIHLGTHKIIYGYSEGKQHYGNRSCLLGDCELMQFTGLYDKNDKRIFEGDIVVSRFANDEICSIGDIQFDCGVFGVEWTINKLNKSMVGVFGQKHNLRRLDDDCIDDIEVIGNIYDNPELIKGENEDERD